MTDGIIQKIIEKYLIQFITCYHAPLIRQIERELIEEINNLGTMTDTEQGIVWIEKSRLIGDNQE